MERRSRDDPDREIAALYRSCAKDLFKYVRSRTDLSTAQDVVENAFAQVALRMANGRCPEDPKPYLFVVARHELYDLEEAGRKQEQSAEAQRVEPRRPADDISTSKDREIDLWSLVARLPRRQSEVMALRYLGDLTFEQVGDILQIRPVTVRTHHDRAIRILEEVLRKEWT